MRFLQSLLAAAILVVCLSAPADGNVCFRVFRSRSPYSRVQGECGYALGGQRKEMGVLVKSYLSCCRRVMAQGWGLSRSCRSCAPIRGRLTPWSQWSLCSRTCGLGNQVRRRMCTTTVCPGMRGKFDFQQRKCTWRPCCPVDGTWSNWSPSTGCMVSCGLGYEFRSRACNSPAASCGGKTCVGDQRQYKECMGTGCPRAEWAPWANQGPCSASCGGGRILRYRECRRPHGDYCRGSSQDYIPCNEKPCEVQPEWCPWTDWGECSVTCGSNSGTRKRTRVCACPPPSGDSKPCHGYNEETSKCNSTNPCPVDGEWGKWQAWSQCTAIRCSHRKGTQTKMRLCDNPPPQHGGRLCEGFFFDRRFCLNVQDCYVEGAYDTWSDWGECKHFCGKCKTKIRRRNCRSPFDDPKQWEVDIVLGVPRLICHRTNETAPCNEADCPNGIQFCKEEIKETTKPPFAVTSHFKDLTTEDLNNPEKLTTLSGKEISFYTAPSRNISPSVKTEHGFESRRGATSTSGGSIRHASTNALHAVSSVIFLSRTKESILNSAPITAAIGKTDVVSSSRFSTANDEENKPPITEKTPHTNTHFSAVSTDAIQRSQPGFSSAAMLTAPQQIDKSHKEKQAPKDSTTTPPVLNGNTTAQTFVADEQTVSESLESLTKGTGKTLTAPSEDLNFNVKENRESHTMLTTTEAESLVSSARMDPKDEVAFTGYHQKNNFRVSHPTTIIKQNGKDTLLDIYKKDGETELYETQFRPDATVKKNVSTQVDLRKSFDLINGHHTRRFEPFKSSPGPQLQFPDTDATTEHLTAQPSTDQALPKMNTYGYPFSTELDRTTLFAERFTSQFNRINTKLSADRRTVDKTNTFTSKSSPFNNQENAKTFPEKVTTYMVTNKSFSEMGQSMANTSTESQSFAKDRNKKMTVTATTEIRHKNPTLSTDQVRRSSTEVATEIVNTNNRKSVIVQKNSKLSTEKASTQMSPNNSSFSEQENTRPSTVGAGAYITEEGSPILSTFEAEIKTNTDRSSYTEHAKSTAEKNYTEIEVYWHKLYYRKKCSKC